MPSFNFQFSRISFWLGFLAATLLWWVIGRIRPMLPQLIAEVRHFFTLLSQRNFSGVENALRRETLRSAQKRHLAAQIFALDEVLITPWLLVPTADGGLENTSDRNITGSATAAQAVPYLPDWTELAAPYAVPRISPAEAVQSGRNLVVIGPPGCGKTVTLATLATQIARRDPALGDWSAAIPLLVHAADLNLPANDSGAPMDVLSRAVSAAAPAILQPQIPRLLRSALRQQRRLVLLLDGLDELPADQLTAAAIWLASLVKAQPLVQVITTGNPDMLDGLLAAGFYPLAVAGWGQPQRSEFTRRWGRMWTEVLLPEIKKQSGSAGEEIDPVLINHWLSGETAPATPLEWALRVWGAFAGDLSGSSPSAAIEAYLTRFLPEPAMLGALYALGGHMLATGAPVMSYDAMDKVLSGTGIASSALAPEENAADAARPKAKKSRASALLTQGEQIIEALVAGGVLVEHPGSKLRFASPAMPGFLAGRQMASAGGKVEDAPSLAELNWAPRALAYQQLAACSEEPDWIYPLVEDPQPPLYATVLAAARWLRDAPPGAVWKTSLMRSLVSMVQSESVPLGIRAKAVAAFVASRDPSIPRLFKQLLESKSSYLRRLALLGCGALGSPQMVGDILPMLGDRVPLVRSAAVMALGAMPGEQALHALVEVLLNGDEDLRQAAAESLARIAPDGHKMLEEAAAEEDLLTRRASVFGLAQVREPWSKKILEKLAIEDGQWVVRNAAAQALDAFQKAAPAVPPPLPAPSEAGWLLTFASKMGLGILPGTPATDVLMAVLKSGSPEEQVAALNYLRSCDDEGVAAAVYELLYSGDEQAADAALYAVWWMAASGAKLPSPSQYGLL